MPFIADKFYTGVVEKLQHTFHKYEYIPEVGTCGNSCSAIPADAVSKDGQIEYLLAVAMCILQNVPASPFLEELFNNYLKDYIHFVNSGHAYHLAEYYLNDDFILKHKNEWSQAQPAAKIRYI